MQKRKREGSLTPLIKSLSGASVFPRAKSNVWPTVLSQEQWGYQICDPGGSKSFEYHLHSHVHEQVTEGRTKKWDNALQISAEKFN